MILGELIKTYRTEHHMSMDDFAKKCGLSKAYISILERNINPVNGKSPIPSLETIKSVSGAMGQYDALYLDHHKDKDPPVHGSDHCRLHSICPGNGPGAQYRDLHRLSLIHI